MQALPWWVVVRVTPVFAAFGLRRSTRQQSKSPPSQPSPHELGEGVETRRTQNSKRRSAAVPPCNFTGTCAKAERTAPVARPGNRTGSVRYTTRGYRPRRHNACKRPALALDPPIQRGAVFDAGLDFDIEAAGEQVFQGQHLAAAEQ